MEENRKITKLILPVAGLGARLRPLTLHVPKNLLPLAGKPIIERYLEEIEGTPVEDVVLVISPEHREQFESFVREMRLKHPAFRFHIREQEKPLGHGHAVYQAADVYHNEPVIVRFCDDILVHGIPTLPAMMEIYTKHGNPLLLLKKVPHGDVSKYGVVEADELQREPSVYRVRSIVEKPNIEDAPSDLVSVGGYIMTPAMLAMIPDMMRETEKKNDALLIPHIFSREIEEGREVYGWEHPGLWLDCGTLEGYKKANEFMAGGKE